jgi:hypothetical protein
MSVLAVNAVTDANGGNTATINSMTPTADSLQGFRNRLINSDMRIDQRNAGASVTAGSGGAFPVDRWFAVEDTDGAMTAEQVEDAPTGFINSVKLTTTTADSSLTTTQTAQFMQNIEGLNVYDLGFGSASAKTVTVSFWVKSSLTGTMGGSLRNDAANRSYPFSYTISSANTWEYKTITIAGDTTGTWLTTNGIGIRLVFSLGSGPSRTGTAGAWNSNNNVAPTGEVPVIGTLNATWYITGVQLEVGSVATPFERRPYGTELALCQRYYAKITGNVDAAIGSGSSTATDIASVYVKYPTTMRSGPTISQSSTKISDARTYSRSVTSLNATFVSTDSARVDVNTASGMSVDRPALFQLDGASGFIAFSSEL